MPLPTDDLRVDGRPTHVLLDLDGTLADSEPGIGGSLRWALEREGFPVPDDEQIRSVIGPPFELGLPSIGVPDDALVRVIARYRERYESTGLFEATMYDGVPEMLDGLVDGGRSISIATAKPEHSARRVLEHLGLTERFDVIAGATLTQERRSKAQVIEHALRQLDLPGGPHVLMVGDRDHDVHGAMRHGIACIGVTYGYGTPEELLTAGAVALADHPGDVVELARTSYRLDGSA